jgi:hypothetical protein
MQISCGPNSKKETLHPIGDGPRIAGLLDRFGFVDPTDGGESHRYSLGAEWRHENGPWMYEANAYAVDYELDLFSNFTYALGQTDGDQFEQLDDRRIYGGRAGVTRAFQIGSRAAQLRFGTGTASRTAGRRRSPG